jgi:plasmid stability protein
VAQLVVRNLPDEVKERLKRRAKSHGRSLEAEVRALLAEAAENDPDAGSCEDARGVGDLVYERFKDVGLTEDELARFNIGIAEINSMLDMRVPDFEEDEYEASDSET